MNKIPTFSICIPNYNYSHYLGETIQSVLDQNYPHFEIIICDNASTDPSIEVIESFNDSRIRLIRNRYNIGFAPNLQAATAHASNDFINLLSSDDKMRPDALETYAQVLIDQDDMANQTVLFSDTYLIDENSQTFGYSTNDLNTFERLHYIAASFDSHKLDQYGSYIKYDAIEVLKKTLSRLKTFAQFLTIVYPRQMWQQIEGYNCVRSVGPDKFFNYKLLSVEPKLIYVRRPLYEYRSHDSPNANAQKSSVKQQLDDYLNTLEFSDEFLHKIGINRNSLIDSFLDRVCLKSGLTQLVHGTYTHAFRLWAFTLSTYPLQVLKKHRFYSLSILLLLGPLAKFVARPLYRLMHKPLKS